MSRIYQEIIDACKDKFYNGGCRFYHSDLVRIGAESGKILTIYDNEAWHAKNIEYCAKSGDRIIEEKEADGFPKFCELREGGGK